MTDISRETDIVTRLQVAMQMASLPHRRGQHFKMHGLVDAVFSIRDDIPDDMRVGLFAAPKDYRAEVRFSNGFAKDDRTANPHGMAIRLYDVAGPKLLEPAGTEHDFILVDYPVFFIRNAAEYVIFFEDFAVSQPKGQPPLKFLAYLQQHHPEDIRVVKESHAQLKENVLEIDYWSQTPFAFGTGGGSICRYRATPQKSADYLRERMLARLSDPRPGVVFDFAVQIKRNATPADIENPTVEWSEPFVNVATIHIPPQVFDTPERRARGEAMLFNPYNAIAEHRPVGEINQIRRDVYIAGQKERRAAAIAKGEQP